MASKTRTFGITELSTTSHPKPTRTLLSSTSLKSTTLTKITTKKPPRPLAASTIALIILGSLVILTAIILVIYFCLHRRKKSTLTPEARAAQLELLGRRERVPGGGYEIPPLYVEPPGRVEPAYVDAVGGYWAPGRNRNRGCVS